MLFCERSLPHKTPCYLALRLHQPEPKWQRDGNVAAALEFLLREWRTVLGCEREMVLSTPPVRGWGASPSKTCPKCLCVTSLCAEAGDLGV